MNVEVEPDASADVQNLDPTDRKLVVSNLSKTFDGIRAVDNLLFAVHEGEPPGIISPMAPASSQRSTASSARTCQPAVRSEKNVGKRREFVYELFPILEEHRDNWPGRTVAANSGYSRSVGTDG